MTKTIPFLFLFLFIAILLSFFGIYTKGEKKRESVLTTKGKAVDSQSVYMVESVGGIEGELNMEDVEGGEFAVIVKPDGLSVIFNPTTEDGRILTDTSLGLQFYTGIKLGWTVGNVFVKAIAGEFRDFMIVKYGDTRSYRIAYCPPDGKTPVYLRIHSTGFPMLMVSGEGTGFLPLVVKFKD